MARKFLNNIDLNGTLTIAGSGGTNGYFLKTDGTGVISWAGASGGSFTGGTLTSNLTLVAGNTSVFPLTFQTNAGTPTATAGTMDYDGTVFYQTSNTTPGRALKVQTYEYVVPASPAGYDFSASSTAQSLLTDSVGTVTTRGITLVAGTTYEFEMYFGLKYQSFGDTTTSLNFGWTTSTVSGSPTTALTSWLDYGNNTTGVTTATSMSSIIGVLGTATNFASPGASGSRYIIWRGRGVIRVTGTGSVKIYPSLTPTAATSNAPSIQGNSYIKITPVGNGTVNGVGAWA